MPRKKRISLTPPPAEKKKDKSKNDIERWRARIEYAVDQKKQLGDDSHLRWDRYNEYYWSKYDTKLNVNIPIVAVNEVYAFVKTAKASLYFKDPYISINPERADSIEGSYILEQDVNCFWRKKKIKKVVKKCIGESKLVGHAFAKMGYGADIEADMDIIGNTNQFITNEQIWCVWVPYKNVGYDMESVDPPFDSRWMYHKYTKPTSYLKDKYGKDIRSTGTLKLDESIKKQLRGEDRERTTVFEIWDKDTMSKLVYCDGYDGWLEEQEAVEKGAIGPYLIDGFPFIMLRYDDIYDTDDHNYPMPEIMAFESQIEEKIKMRSMQLSHIKRFGRQYMVKKGAVDNENQDKFEKGIDGSMIEVNGDLQNSITPVSYPNLQQDIYPAMRDVDIDRDKISGQPQMEQGAASQTRTRTLGELQEIKSGSDNRRTEQRDVIEDFCEEIATKYIQLATQFFDMDRMVAVTGERKENILKALANKGKFDGVSIKFNKSDIKNLEYGLDVKMGSTIPLNKEGLLTTIAQLARFGPAFGLTPESYASKALGKELFRIMDMLTVQKGYDLDLIERAKPKQPPLDQQIKMKKDIEGIKHTAVDTQMKQSRMENLGLQKVGQLIKNQQNLKDLKEPKPSAGEKK